ncbi:MAG: hypothetical protein HN348_18045 [Proteobacteria bacterium]|nr:hypothetical protein [Pseudomonadota bacterium]
MLFLVLVCSCKEPHSDPSSTPKNLYDTEQVLEISISINEDDWQELQSQSRHYLDVLGESCNSSPTQRPYTYFPADITIDGETMSNVGVRKKGFFGSTGDGAPSLKVKFSEYQDQFFHDAKRLTLNNNQGDPSQIKQCLGYDLFSRAGVPAPRCNFAVVEVNGVSMGTYTNVESIKKRFLERHFDDNDGNLYEGQLSDFRQGWVESFQRKTKVDEGDRSDIDALVPALEVEDTSLLQTIEPLIDLGGFYDFWAMEILLMHGDGYARNTNNFYIYADPTTGQFTFIPWGIDVILAPDRTWSWEQSPPPGVAWAVGVLARRLYLYEPSQEVFLERLQTHLDEVLVEDDILDEIDRMDDLLQPHLSSFSAAEQGLIADSMDEVRDYVATRRDDLQPILDQAPATWDEPLRDPWCLTSIGEVSGEFTGTWGGEGQGVVDLVLHGENFDDQDVSLVVDTDEDDVDRVELSFFADDTQWFVEIPLEEMDLDGPLPVDFEIAPGGGSVSDEIEVRALFGGGTLHFDEAGFSRGSTIIGSFAGSLYPYLDE